MYNICFGTQYRSRRSGAPWGYQGRKAVSRLVAKGMLYNTALYVFVLSTVYVLYTIHRKFHVGFSLGQRQVRTF